MKVYKKKKIITLIYLLITIVFNAQNKSALNLATKDYDKYSYIRATDILLDVVKKGYENQEILEKLGNSYFFNNKMEDAAKWYEKLIMNYTDFDSEYYYRYSQALKALEKYEEADKWMSHFTEVNDDDKRSLIFNSQKNYLEVIEGLSKNIEVKNLEINTEFSDFGGNIYKDQLVFASTRGKGRNYQWNNQSYLNLYSAQKDNNDSYNSVKLFDKKGVNTKYHESSVAFMPLNEQMFFTRNNYFKNKIKRDGLGVNRLQIFRAELKPDGFWGNITSVHFNSKEYSVAHPTINKQGTKLYFSSDMPGSLGQSDLYVVDINEDGTLGEPLNLGGIINTEGQETFPFINSRGDLFFSSNGRNGLGGLDVYVIRDFEYKYSENSPISVVNMGKPINSSMDDFAYFENLNSKLGLFSSNRPGGKGDDDIYKFEVVDFSYGITGVVMDEKSQDLLPNAEVILSDATGREISKTNTNEKGYYQFNEVLNNQYQYIIRASKESYQQNEIHVSLPKNSRAISNLDVHLEKEIIAIATGVNLSEALNLNPIYFNLDKDNIRYDAEIELQKVITVMMQYPNMVIKIESHTDSRNTHEYNLDLSDRRAKSTRDYIISQGIEASRIESAKGYGETQLINNCSNGVSCSEEDHQLNRRSEFIIIKM